MTHKVTSIQKPQRQVQIGSMKDLIKVRTRQLKAPQFATDSLTGEPITGVDFNEEFVNPPFVHANIKTVEGAAILDGVNQSDVLITHEVRIRYDESVSSDTWVELVDGVRLKVERYFDLDERKRFMVLLCNERGDLDTEASSL